MGAGSPIGRVTTARDAVIRAATAADLPDCGRIWRDALNDYMGRLNMPTVPDQLEGIGRLHAHTLATDPERFVVAVERNRNAGSETAARNQRLVGFASAIERGAVWYLSMLFVAPRAQGGGLGRRLLDRVLPPLEERDHRPLALATDSAQPISNGLYASLGIVPRLPVYQLIGRPRSGAQLPPLPAGSSIEEAAPRDLAEADDLSGPSEQPHEGGGESPGGPLLAEIGELDRALLGAQRLADHRYALDTGRRLFLCRAADGSLLGYGYASPVGHLGPIAVRDPGLLPALTAWLLLRIEPRGASAIWLPGAAGETFTMLLRAGLRLDGFPVLLCWSRAFADFGRYLPLSPGLL